MNRKLTCIVCPGGCEIDVEFDGTGIQNITGAVCDRGRNYAASEITNPMRSVSSSVRLTGGMLPLASVRLTSPVPKNRMTDVMAEIRQITVDAPVSIGQVVVKNILGLESDLIITKNIDKMSGYTG